MKKLISILLTLVMVLSVSSVTAFAEIGAPGRETGTITISPASQNATYKVFKLFDLDTYNTASHAYSYMIAKDSPWYKFFENNATYFTIDTTEHTRGGKTYYYITATNSYTETTAVDVAKAALEYANVATNGVTATQTITETDTDGTVVFSGLDLGYYLVDTSVGALCGLTTTLPNAEIAVKNYPPTLTKYVKEDDISVGNPWGVSNDAAFGELVEFDVTINARVGAHNYVFHDKMEPGLEFTKEGFVAKWAKAGATTGTELKAGTEDAVAKNEVDYAIIIGDDATCTFEVVFSEKLCNDLRDNDTIVLTYYAKVTAVDELDEDGIKNEAWVTYGDYIANAEPGARQLSTKHASTLTYTYGFDIIKTNETGMMLPGAKFALFATQEAAAAAMATPAGTEPDLTNAIALEAIGTNSYRIMVEGATGTAVKDFTIVMDNNNRTVARIIGLDDGTYYLAELAAPAGYNELAAPRAVSIADGNIFAGYKDDAYDGVSGVHIENRTGASMPTTGGTGTAMFITIGSITVIGAGVLLVTKKRMSMIEED